MIKKEIETQSKGITLVSLVVTIIILLILSGISIGMISGNNGIINQAGNAKNSSVADNEVEAISLAYTRLLGRPKVDEVSANDLKEELGNNGFDVATQAISQGIKVVFNNSNNEYVVNNDGFVNEYTPPPVADTLLENPESYGDNAQATADGDGKYFPKPTGATYKEGTVDTGVVIEYKGSEFVWVPVPIVVSDTEADGTTNKAMAVKVGNDYRGLLYNFSGTSSSVVTGCISRDFFDGEMYYEPIDLEDDKDSEPWLSQIGLTNSEFKSEIQNYYNKMIESIKSYGGFYVGRYETSINGSTVASVKNSMPATTETESASRWYGFYDKEKKFSPESDSSNSVVSNMICGNQYDAMLNWILKGTEKTKVTATVNGNHSGTVAGCGMYNSGSDKINNIYDLEGNLREITMEACCTLGDTRVCRGGSYSTNLSASPASDRGSPLPYATSSTVGSRLSLYIK